jgi:hypothetical protein
MKESVRLLCKNHETYLKIIYHLGNKVITLKQLFQYAELLGITGSQTKFRSSVKELEEAKIIEISKLIGEKTTQLHYITLKKNGIMFIDGEEDSRKVAPVPKSKNEDRILLSIFRNCHILDRQIPLMREKGEEVVFDSIYKKFNGINSTLLYEKNQGYIFLERLKKSDYCNSEEIETVLKQMNETLKKRQVGLEKAQRTKSQGMGNATLTAAKGAVQEAENRIKPPQKKTKREKIATYSVDSMLHYNAFVTSIRGDEDKKKIYVNVVIYDLHGSQNVYKIATHVACIFEMFRRYFYAPKDKAFSIILTVRVFTTSHKGAEHMKSEKERIVTDPRTKVQDQLLEKTLHSWIDEQGDNETLENIKVYLDYFDIENRFFEGKKYLNLKQNQIN